MKKWILLVLALFCTPVLFSLDLPPISWSAGGGFQWDFLETNQKITGTSTYWDKVDTTLMGVNAFLDGRYFLVGLDYSFILGKSKRDMKQTNPDSDTQSDLDSGLSYLNITFLGKLPFTVPWVKELNVYPLVGLEFDKYVTLNVAEDTYPQRYKDDFNEFFLDFGFGGDYALDQWVKSLYVRAYILWGIDVLNSKAYYGQTALDSGLIYTPELCYKITPSLQLGYQF